MNTNDIKKMRKLKKMARPKGIVGKVMVSSADVRRIERPRGAVRKFARIAADRIIKKRRSLLQSILLGSGTFLAGKIFGPSINLFSSNQDLGDPLDFKNFRVVETNKSLTFFDKMGNEILTIDK